MERNIKEKINNTKLYLGPMSKNVVDSLLTYQGQIGIIASRRQIDYINGYVNNWNTKNFVKYIKSINKNIIICRDHGGINQGKTYDDGIMSFIDDSEYMDIIHIDPFKYYDLYNSIEYTLNIIKRCSTINKNILFEIGTEESIFPMSVKTFGEFLHETKKRIPYLFPKIIYAVIQSGTLLKSGKNIGEYDEKKLSKMLKICDEFGVLSKEHNGDYLTPSIMKNKFHMGLSSINIAPELAKFENEYIVKNIDKSRKNKWIELLIKNEQWKKWFPIGTNPYDKKEEILSTCGHYVFTNPDFINIFDLKSIFKYVESNIHNFINDRLNK